MRQCDVPESFLQGWAPGESKRDVLDRLFLELPKSDNGRSGLVRMAGFLLEQDSFPDLNNWEDSAAKLKGAHDAVSQLRRYHSKQQEEIQSEEDKVAVRKRFAERQRQASQSQQTLQSLDDRLKALALSLGEQKAGYDFQKWFYELLDFSEISNRKPYVHKGRQIDGSDAGLERTDGCREYVTFRRPLTPWSRTSLCGSRTGTPGQRRSACQRTGGQAWPCTPRRRSAPVDRITHYQTQTNR